MLGGDHGCLEGPDVAEGDHGRHVLVHRENVRAERGPDEARVAGAARHSAVTLDRHQNYNSVELQVERHTIGMFPLLLQDL